MMKFIKLVLSIHDSFETIVAAIFYFIFILFFCCNLLDLLNFISLCIR